MTLRACTSAMVGGCGINILYGFEAPSTYWQKLNYHFPILSQGTGFTIANFVNENNCKKTYKVLSSRYPIVYQSPVRKNSRSGRDGFFVVFDTSKKGS